MGDKYLAWGQNVYEQARPHLPQLAIALAVLVGGWFVAWIAKLATFNLLKRTNLDDKLGDFLGFDTSDHAFERVVSKVVYYTVLGFVFVAFFDRLGIEAVTQPVLGVLSGMTSAIPAILKAVIIGVVGFLLATGLRRAVIFVLQKTALVPRIERLLMGKEAAEQARSEREEQGQDEPAPVVKTMGDIVYWFVLVVAAVPILEALSIGALAEPLSMTVAMVTTYVPRVLAATVLLVAGYIAGRIAKAVITRISSRVGIDGLAKRFGIARALGDQTIGSLLGTFVMAIILLHFTISAVGRLDIEEITAPLGLMLAQVYAWLPKMLGGAALLAVGVVLAKVVSNVVSRLLAGMGFNTLLSYTGLYQPSDEARAQEAANKGVVEASRKNQAETSDELLAAREERAIETPADVAGVIAGAVIVLLFLRQALGTMELLGLAAMLDSLVAYLPRVLVALVLVGAGLWAGRWVKSRLDEITKSSQDPLARVAGTAARVLTVSFSILLALEQLGIARRLVLLTFGLIMGAACLALALAFGLGGREVAAKILDKEYSRRN